MSKDREDEFDGVPGESVDPTDGAFAEGTADAVDEADIAPGVSDPEALAEAEEDVADDAEARIVDEAGVAVPSEVAVDDDGDLVRVDESDPDLVDAELADPALDDSDDELEAAAVGATAGSARAAARRSARAGVTEKKGAATRTRADATRGNENIFQRLGRFFREVVAELGKVIWPGRNQMVTYSIVVILFLIFMVALVYGLDILFTWAVDAVLG